MTPAGYVYKKRHFRVLLDCPINTPRLQERWIRNHCAFSFDFPFGFQYLHSEIGSGIFLEIYFECFWNFIDIDLGLRDSKSERLLCSRVE